MDSRNPTVDFVLPGTWWRIPLDSDATVKAKIKRLAEEAFGKADELATRRRELAQMLGAAARDAKSVGGQDFYFAIEIVPGGRVPLSLSVAWPRVPETVSMHAGPGAAAMAFAARASRSWADAAVEVLDSDSAGVVRVLKTKVIADPDQGDATAAPLSKVTIDYWFFGPMHDRAFLMSFASPLAEESEGLVTLCDAIASSVTWANEPDDQAAEPVA
ncbi:MAG: hypothetical protein IPM08_14225 [Actinomycetales bacterium]|nr:hypothetical protein [Actinomycetales bacterium]